MNNVVMAMSRAIAALLIITAASAGCAKYQYAIIEPADLAQPIPRTAQAAVQVDPLGYEFVDLGHQLGVRIFNDADEPITLLGERSYVVDPEGQSHPLRGGTIAPSSYAAFTIPAMARIHHGGPRIGIGIGVSRYSGHHHFGGGFGGSWHDDYPYGYTETYRSFRWTTGDVRLRLVHERDEHRLEHEFLLRRQRIDD